MSRPCKEELVVGSVHEDKLVYIGVRKEELERGGVHEDKPENTQGGAGVWRHTQGGANAWWNTQG